MRFGLILLGLIIAVSLIGSLIPQNNEAMYYVRNYPDTAQLILNLQLNRVFTSWYFILLVVLLCVNLIFCSILRIRRMPETEALPESFTPAERFGKGDRELLEADLSSRGYRAERNGNLVRYTGNQIGVYVRFCCISVSCSRRYSLRLDYRFRKSQIRHAFRVNPSGWMTELKSKWIPFPLKMRQACWIMPVRLISFFRMEEAPGRSGSV